MRVARRLLLLASLYFAASVACTSFYPTDGVFPNPEVFDRCFYGATEAPDIPGEIWFVLEQKEDRAMGCWGRLSSQLPGAYGDVNVFIESDDGQQVVADLTIVVNFLPIPATATLDRVDPGSKDDDLLTVRPDEPGNDHLFSTRPLQAATVAAGVCPSSCEELSNFVARRPWPPELEMSP